MFRTTSDTSTTVSPLSTPNLKSSKKSSFMVLSSDDKGFATISACARRVHSLRMLPVSGPVPAFGLPLRRFLWYTYMVHLLRERSRIDWLWEGAALWTPCHSLLFQPSIDPFWCWRLLAGMMLGT